MTETHPEFGVFGPDILHSPEAGLRREWLEADGRGGYASGTICGARTRVHHALLLVATRPPTERRALVQTLEEWITPASNEAENVFLSSHRYAPDSIHPDGMWNLREFRLYPWPTWSYLIETSGGTIEIEKEIMVPFGQPSVLISWRLVAGPRVTLKVRPLLSGRDYHALQRRNNLIDTSYLAEPGGLSWQTYPGTPRVHARTNGDYVHEPDWYMNFIYDVERERGLGFIEDLWSPGTLSFALSANSTAVLLFSTEGSKKITISESALKNLRRRERNRRGAMENTIEITKPAAHKATPSGVGPRAPDHSVLAELSRSADAYIVRRKSGKTVIAGYPWFTDWGRDTFISMRGLLLSRGKIAEAGKILAEWAGMVDQGMLPNHFPDEGDTPQYNSVDASLWFIIVAGEYLARTRMAGINRLLPAMEAIMEGYSQGTRYGIKLEIDGLLHAGEPGSQLTWMDAKYDDVCFTPRIGKPVEVQALWLNAVATMQKLSREKKMNSKWGALFKKAQSSFRKKFWNKNLNCLFDVIEGPEGDDASMRPNQIFAVSLPAEILSARQARAVVDAVERELVTPMGLRTLSASSPGSGYIGVYAGDRKSRDAAYHNGTVWPWLLGPFIESWVKVRKNSSGAKREARKFLAGIENHVADAGLGSISEVADGDAPHEPKGCPFQAWSVAEILRVLMEVLK